MDTRAESPRCVHVRGERRDEGSSVLGQGCVGLRVPVGRFWQVGGDAVKGLVEKDGPGSTVGG